MSDHSWVRARAVAYRAGLLDPEDADRVEAHLQSCSECRDHLNQLEPVEMPESATVEHPPAAMLARWPAAARELSPMERDLVVRHLKRCSSCQASLALVGHEVEPAEALAERTTGDAPKRPGARRASDGMLRPRAGWRIWTLGGWAAAATAAALVLAIQPRIGREARETPPRPTEAPTEGPASTRLLLVLPPLVALSSQQRGSPATLTEVSIDSLAPALALSLPAQVARIEDVSEVAIILVAPDGAEISRARSSPAEWVAPRILVVERGPRPWAEGRYRLGVEILSAPGALVPAPETRTYEFHLRRHRE